MLSEMKSCSRTETSEIVVVSIPVADVGADERTDEVWLFIWTIWCTSGSCKIVICGWLGRRSECYTDVAGKETGLTLKL